MAEGSFETDVLRLLGEAWQTQRSESTWIHGVVEAAARLLAPDLGIVGAALRLGGASPPELSVVPCARDLPERLFQAMGALVEFGRQSRDIRRDFASRVPVMSFSEFSCYAQLCELLQPVGIRDVVVLFTGPVFGTSLVVAANYREQRRLGALERATLVAAVRQLTIAFNCHLAQQAALIPAAPPAQLLGLLEPEQLSVELRCVELLGLGLETAEIAQALQISPEAARRHIARGMKRFGVRTRRALVERSSRWLAERARSAQGVHR